MRRRGIRFGAAGLCAAVASLGFAGVASASPAHPEHEEPVLLWAGDEETGKKRLFMIMQSHLPSATATAGAGAAHHRGKHKASTLTTRVRICAKRKKGAKASRKADRKCVVKKTFRSKVWAHETSRRAVGYSVGLSPGESRQIQQLAGSGANPEVWIQSNTTYDPPNGPTTQALNTGNFNIMGLASLFGFTRQVTPVQQVAPGATITSTSGSCAGSDGNGKTIWSMAVWPGLGAPPSSYSMWFASFIPANNLYFQGIMQELLEQMQTVEALVPEVKALVTAIMQTLKDVKAQSWFSVIGDVMTDLQDIVPIVGNVATIAENWPSTWGFQSVTNPTATQVPATSTAPWQGEAYCFDFHNPL